MDNPLQIASNFVVPSEEFEAEAVEVFDAADVRDAWRGDRQS
jgi:hypothetical protein